MFQEGKQASLAADFSITQFKHIGRLLMVHGRNSYKRSAALGQFVMHRGMIISTMQVTHREPHVYFHFCSHIVFTEVARVSTVNWFALSSKSTTLMLLQCSLLIWSADILILICVSSQAVFSSIFYFASVPLYQGFLMVG